MKELSIVLATAEKDLINQFLDQSSGPCEMVIRVGPDGAYYICYVNSFAAQMFGLKKLNIGDEPLEWEELPELLTHYFSTAFLGMGPDHQMTLPVFELRIPKHLAFAVKARTDKIQEPDGWTFWFHFSFSDVTPWLGLQEEVMNARKLESIGALASGVAHDFNNIIMAIQGNAEFLSLTRREDEELKASMERIIKACTNGASLTRSLLGFARRQSLVMDALNVADLVHDVVELCRRSYGARYTIEIDELLVPTCEGGVADESKMILGCYTALSHSLLNVMNNSRDAMPEGGSIHISHRAENNLVELTVSDKGSGISVADMARIFEPFFTTKGLGAGTGLGLPMVHGIMQQHGGNISVQSEYGTGTSMIFVWPRYVKTNEAEEAPETSEEPLDFPLPADTSKNKVAFVIDDNKVVVESIKFLLQLNGFNVRSFAKAEEVIHLMRAGTMPRLILVDFTMPGMDGLEFIRTMYADLKKLDKPPFIKVILMSGYPPEHFKSFRQEFKGNSLFLLQKPFSSETLKKLIDTRSSRFLRKITSRINVLPQME